MYRNLCIFSWTVLSFKSLQIWSQAASMKLTVLSPVVLKPVLVSTCTCTKGSQNLRDQHLKLYLFLLQVGFVCSFFCWIPMNISYLEYGNRFVVAFTLSDMRETVILFRGLKIKDMKCMERIYIGYCLLSNPFGISFIYE